MPTFPRRTVLKSVAAAPVSIPTLDSSTDHAEHLEPDIEQIMGYSRYNSQDVGLQTDTNQRLLSKYTSNHLFEIMDVKNLDIHSAYLEYPRVNDEPVADAFLQFFEFPESDSTVSTTVFHDVYGFYMREAERCYDEADESAEVVSTKGNLHIHDYFIARARNPEKNGYQKCYVQFLPEGVSIWDVAHTGDLDREWFSIEEHQEFLKQNVIDSERSVFTDTT
jgi:hypothetical protein